MPRMAISGRLTMGVKCPPPMPPWLEMVKQPPCSSSTETLRSRVFAASSLNSFDRRQHVLLVHVAQHRDDQALLGVHRQADVKILLPNHFPGRFVQAAVENGMLLQRPGHDLEREGRSASDARPSSR